MSSSGSALWGDPPANANDRSILIGLEGSQSGKFKVPPKLPLAPGAPESHATGFIIGTAFAIALIVLITGARLATRALFRGQKFGLDDVVIIPASLLVLAFHACNLASISYAGAGKHVNYVTYEQLQLFRVLGYVNQVLFFAAVTLVKISMVLFNRRVTGLSSKSWRVFHHVFLGVLVVWFFISLFVNIFQCTPAIALFTYWGQAEHPDYKCFNKDDIAISFSVINAVTDFILFCVPIYIILRVRMSWGRKLRLVMLFGLGAVCVTASIVRTTLAGQGSAEDYTWSTLQTISWTVVDITFSAAVASLPALNGLFETAIMKVTSQSSAWLSWRYGSGSKGQGSDETELNAQSNPPSKIPSVRKRPNEYDELV